MTIFVCFEIENLIFKKKKKKGQEYIYILEN